MVLNNSLNPNSTQLFIKYGTNTFRPEIKYGNVVLDEAEVAIEDFGGKLETIQGDFEIRKTGNGNSGVYFSGDNLIYIGGNFVQTGGRFLGGCNGILTCHVSEDFILKGGEFNDVKSDNSKQKASLKMKVSGDVILLNGTFASDLSVTSEFILSGPGTSRWIQKPFCKVALGNVTIAQKHTLQIKGSAFGEISKGRIFQVSEGAEFFCEQVVIKGEGEFVLENNAMLGIGHAQGIYSHGAKGNIQTAKRSFNSGATYYYYTNSQPQETGVFQTVPNQKTIAKLVVHKTSTSQVLNLSQDLEVDSPCQVSLGDIRSNGFEIVVRDDISTAKLK